MPKKKITKKDELDRFYTDPKVACLCYQKVLPFINDTDLLVEPSAGNGSFYLQMREPKIGIDLEPGHSEIVKLNWLEQKVPEDCVIIGNPPFGERNLLTKAFIKHSIQGARIIAFILPTVFRKETNQKVFPENWSLVKDYSLPENSFIFDGHPYHVPTCFQIWQKNSNYKNLRKSIQQKSSTTDFFFTDINPTHFVFGAAPYKLISPNEVKTNNRGYYLQANIDNIEDKFKNINWNEYSLSSVNGGVSWFTKQEIIDAYNGIKPQVDTF